VILLVLIFLKTKKSEHFLYKIKLQLDNKMLVLKTPHQAYLNKQQRPILNKNSMK
jgi:hypothetical protein